MSIKFYDQELNEQPEPSKPLNVYEQVTLQKWQAVRHSIENQAASRGVAMLHERRSTQDIIAALATYVPAYETAMKQIARLTR